MQAIEDGMYEGDGSVASCFWPRHGVRVVTSGKAVDYVICYECLGMGVFSDEGQTGQSISRSHQKVLTDPLTAAGIKLAPSMKEKKEASRSANSN